MPTANSEISLSTPKSTRAAGQPGVADVGAVEVQDCKNLHPFQVLQSSIGDLGVVEGQVFNSGHPFQMLQTRVGDVGAYEGQ